MPTRTWTRRLFAAVAGFGTVLAAVAAEPADERRYKFRLYVDGEYSDSSTDPANHLWRSKSSTYKIDLPEINLAMAELQRFARQDGRWGFSFGLQTGIDSEGLVPPAGADPLGNANDWRYLYRANGSYLFATERRLQLTFGLINSYIGYESFLSAENPNYTRAYLSDAVPYFLVGTELLWSATDNLDVGFYVVSGFSYLANPNDVPSYGASVSWAATPRLTLTENLYYGPDQTDSSIDYWRFLSDTILEWQTERWSLAAVYNHGFERQAAIAGQPRWTSIAAALWVRWQASRRLSLVLRPELMDDPDGLATGVAQRIEAVTATLKAKLQPARHHTLELALEFRRDRSTGADGGFYDGPSNRLVEYQNLALIGVVWSFERTAPDTATEPRIRPERRE